MNNEILDLMFNIDSGLLGIIYLTWTGLILGIAGYWDYKYNVVPNLLWFVAFIPVPSTFLFKDIGFELIFLLGLFVYSYVLWKKNLWGMGDLKTVMWLGLMTTGGFSLLMTFTGMFLAWILPKVLKKEKLGNKAFVPYIVFAFGITGLSITLYSVIAY